jgi:hypothetical protein
MRIHLAALSVAALFVLFGPRPQGSQALEQGIPLGDLMRPIATHTPTPPHPEVPTDHAPSISQLTPNIGGSTTTTTNLPGSTGASSGAPAGAPGTNLGTATTVGNSTPGLNVQNPGLGSTTPYNATVGGAPPAAVTPSTGGPVTGNAPAPASGGSSTTAAAPATSANGAPASAAAPAGNAPPTSATPAGAAPSDVPAPSSPPATPAPAPTGPSGIPSPADIPGGDHP